MSLIPEVKNNKRCFMYCGDEVCDCSANKGVPRMTPEEIQARRVEILEDWKKVISGLDNVGEEICYRCRKGFEPSACELRDCPNRIVRGGSDE